MILLQNPYLAIRLIRRLFLETVDRGVITDGGLREPAAGQTAARVEGPQARIPPCGV